MKSYRIIFSLIICLVVTHVYSQQQFKLHYTFKKKKFYPPYLREDVTDDGKDVLVGYVLQPDGTKYSLHVYTAKRIYKPRKIGGKIKGRIDYRDGDTLFIHFWNYTNKNFRDTSVINYNDNGKTFTFYLDSTVRKGIRIPFHFFSFNATNLSTKYDLSTKKMNENFLNVNISFMYVPYGFTRIFKNQDISPRDFYIAAGPYGGVTNLPSTDDYSHYGFTYGACIGIKLLTFNLIASYGVEVGDGTSSTTTHTYLGFGFGFNLLSLSSSSN